MYLPNSEFASIQTPHVHRNISEEQGKTLKRKISVEWKQFDYRKEKTDHDTKQHN